MTHGLYDINGAKLTLSDLHKHYLTLCDHYLVEIHDGGERQGLIDGITTTIYYRKIPTVR